MKTCRRGKTSPQSVHYTYLLTYLLYSIFSADTRDDIDTAASYTRQNCAYVSVYKIVAGRSTKHHIYIYIYVDLRIRLFYLNTYLQAQHPVRRVRRRSHAVDGRCIGVRGGKVGSCDEPLLTGSDLSGVAIVFISTKPLL